MTRQGSDHQHLGFVLSLPDRTLRALAVIVGGLVHETPEVLLPGWLRRISPGARSYLDALASKPQRDLIMPVDVDLTSVEELLDTLEETSDQMVNMVDNPPLNLEDQRHSWKELKTSATDLRMLVVLPICMKICSRSQTR